MKDLEHLRCPHCGLPVFYDSKKKRLVNPDERGDAL